jgi:hypothetical protein|tara:strand:+ start:281 stop:454 length:174 start_codon:yes stop_codon:yes gene_type:complete
MEPAEKARNVADQITRLADDMERDIKNAIALLKQAAMDYYDRKEIIALLENVLGRVG